MDCLLQIYLERRREAASRLSSAMEQQLDDLNMKRARFSVEMEQVLDANGGLIPEARWEEAGTV